MSITLPLSREWKSDRTKNSIFDFDCPCLTIDDLRAFNLHFFGYSGYTSRLKPLSLRTRLVEPFTTNKADRDFMLHFFVNTVDIPVAWSHYVLFQIRFVKQFITIMAHKAFFALFVDTATYPWSHYLSVPNFLNNIPLLRTIPYRLYEKLNWYYFQFFHM